MAKLEQNMHVHISWDTEPTDGAKALIQLEVRNALQETFQEQSWFRELVQAEVQRELGRIREANLTMFATVEGRGAHGRHIS